ncbi:unnamed protein product [Victoria cruziana]
MYKLHPSESNAVNLAMVIKPGEISHPCKSRDPSPAGEISALGQQKYFFPSLPRSCSTASLPPRTHPAKKTFAQGITSSHHNAELSSSESTSRACSR